jgi:hypothetical protein
LGFRVLLINPNPWSRSNSRVKCRSTWHAFLLLSDDGTGSGVTVTGYDHGFGYDYGYDYG